MVNTLQVQITVVDKNDNQPLIEEDCYFWNISEGSLPGQSFIEIRASDRDLDMNANISFEIINSPDSKYIKLLLTSFKWNFFLQMHLLLITMVT